MIERVRFTKKQRLVLQRAFSEADCYFDESMKEKPYLYHESDRLAFVRGYVSSFLDSIVDGGFAYLEDV